MEKGRQAGSSAYSAGRLAADHGAGRGGCVVRAARASSANCPWPTIWRPPSATPKHGFPVTQLIALYWKGNMAAFEKDKALIEELDNARATYLIDGHTPAEGEVFRNPDLAHTLTLIAKGGRDAFYKGAIAHTIDAYFKRIGGDLRYEDFASHHGEWVTPLVGQLSRLRRLRTAAQRPGRRGSADAADPQRLRSEEDGRGLGGHADGDAGSEAAGLRGSCEVVCRSGLRARCR